METLMQLRTSEIEFFSFGVSAAVKLDVSPPLITPSESQPLSEEGEREGERLKPSVTLSHQPAMEQLW